jgi:hypothetical protein
MRTKILRILIYAGIAGALVIVFSPLFHPYPRLPWDITGAITEAEEAQADRIIKAFVTHDGRKVTSKEDYDELLRVLMRERTALVEERDELDKLWREMAKLRRTEGVPQGGLEEASKALEVRLVELTKEIRVNIVADYRASKARRVK